jgi:hypothetical protein
MSDHRPANSEKSLFAAVSVETASRENPYFEALNMLSADRRVVA